MGWYVFALVDAPPAARLAKGLTGALALRRVGETYAVVERRADVPPADFGTLQRHHAVVQQLADQVPAILPVRFGTLLEGDALDEALQEREEDLEDAFAAVRGRVQFTWRLEGTRRPSAARARSASATMATSGSDYLRRAARAARPAPPAAWRPLRLKLARLVAAERYQAATPASPDTLYHLVARDEALRYQAIGRAMQHANPRLSLTGPWPPFAFAPEQL